MGSILSITPQDVGSSSGGDGEGGVAKKVKDYIEKIPELIDRFMLKQKIKADMGNPMNVVLQQEVERYETIIRLLMSDLEEIELGLKGTKAITPYLEKILNCINLNEVPAPWSKGYFTMKPLSNWFEDLRQRYQFFDTWSTKGTPFVFWLGAFTFPTGFTTSLMQRFSRKANSAPIDQLTFEFTPMNRPPHEIQEHPKDGAYVTKLYLEGAKWDHDTNALCEPNVMELIVMMPVLWFKPITKQKKPPANMYPCPAYYYPTRTGTVYKDSF